MRKIFSAIILGSLVLALALPAAAQTAPATECDVSEVLKHNVPECPAAIDNDDDGKCIVEGTDAHENCGFCCMLNTVYKITSWMFYILMLIVAIMIIWGGFIYVTAAGDPEKAGKGKQVLTFAIIGLAIALLAKVIPSVVRFVIGV